jgi:hypothetical protein
MAETTPSLTPRTGLWLTLITLVSIPLWLLGGRWLQEEFTGWAELAARYPADGRTLNGSVGTVIMSIQHGDGPHHQFRDRRARYGAFIEAGLTEDGFWLRSTEPAPSPPIYVPWTAVRHCSLFSATLSSPAPGEPAPRLLVQHPAFERACASATSTLDRAGR